MASLASFNRLNVDFALSDRNLMMGYRTVLSDVAAYLHLSFSSAKHITVSKDTMTIFITDSMTEVYTHLGEHNFFILLHVNDQGLTPRFDILFGDFLLTSIPSVKQFSKLIRLATRSKKSKNHLVKKLQAFQQALDAGALDKIEILALEISNSARLNTGIGPFLDSLVYKSKGEYEKAFESLVKAHELYSNGPLYLYELINLLKTAGNKDQALDLALKYVNSFPRCFPVLETGIEYSIMRAKFEYLSTFFDAVGDVSEAKEDRFPVIYNAALSVYIRYLCRKGLYDQVPRFVKSLVASTSRELYWKGVLNEFFKILPLSYWEDLYKLSTLQNVMSKSFPQEHKILYELVSYGADSAKVTCKSLESQGELTEGSKILAKRLYQLFGA